MLNSGDRYVINYFLGLKYVSIYSVAYFLAYMVVLVTAPICHILYPALSAFCNNKNYAEASKYIKYSTKYVLLIGIAAAFGILALKRPLILLFSTRELLGATKVMPLLLLGLFIFQAGIISTYIIRIFDHTKEIMLLCLVLAAMNIGLNIAVIPHMGIAGAALTTLLTFSCFSAFTIAYSQKFLPHALDILLIGKAIAAAVVMSVTVSLFKPQSLFSVTLASAAGAGVYILTLYGLRVFEGRETIFFRNLFLSAKG